MTDKARETIADIAEEGIDNVHDIDITLRGYAEGATDAILAALPEIIRQNPSIIADMVKPLNFVEQRPLNEHSMPVYLAEMGDITGYRIEEHRPEYGEPKGFWLALDLNGLSSGIKREIPTYDKAESIANAHNLATILKALGMKEGE